ncbi:titin-like [Achroia grisella]|uniref:titin-like n=1 Tax=Achroia grisella TaxID=688607 RepID=UPI0027D2C931|nr:titin-like [Achroia grisella]
MDRLNQLRGEAGCSRDSTLDTTSPPSEAFMTANESSSKYFSLSEVDSTFDISPIKDVSLPSTTISTDSTVNDSDQLISNLSPIVKKNDLLDSYKIGKQIEAANILSGGVNIFDDNDNSYDGDELIIDDNVDLDDKSNSDIKDSDTVQFKQGDNTEVTAVNTETATASKDTEVVLQIDGKNVDAIDIGNGLYLYRKEGQEELAAVQIIDDDQQQPSFKFLKVRENAEGNLEVYEEIQIEVTKEVPTKQEKSVNKNVPHVPIKDINKVMSDHSSNKVAEKDNKALYEEPTSTKKDIENEQNKDLQSETKTEVNVNGKMMKFSEARKSPLIGSFTPMTYHSTPNKEGIPLTKTMVDQQLHPNRHSDNIKKTIEVHTDSSKQRTLESQNKLKGIVGENKSPDFTVVSKETECLNENCNKDLNPVSADPVKIVQNHTSNENKYTEEATKKSNEISTIPNSINESEINKQKQSVNANKTIDMKEQSIDANKLVVIEKAVEKPEVTHNKANEPQNKEDSIINCNDNINNIITNSVSTKLNPFERKIVDTKENKEHYDNKADNKIQDNKQHILVTQNKNDKVTGSDLKPSVTQATDTLLLQKHTNISETKHVSKEVCIIEDQCRDNVKHDTLMKSEKKNQEFASNVSNESKHPTDVIDQKFKTESLKMNTTTTEHLNTTAKPLINEISNINCTLSITDSKITPNKTEVQVCNDDNKDKKSDSKVTVSAIPTTSQPKTVMTDKNDIQKVNSTIPKPTDYNQTGVPFGLWTEENKQEFINKMKEMAETKVPTTSSNGKQIKNSNDLNRRDVLKKIDSQRQSSMAKTQEGGPSGIPRPGTIKKELNVFTNKSLIFQDKKVVIKPESIVKVTPILIKNTTKHENISKSLKETPDTTTFVAVDKKESTQRKEINNQELIDKTIEGIINRVVPNKHNTEEGSPEHTENNTDNLDDLEIKMNKIHGISFGGKPQDEVSSASDKPTFKTYSKLESDKSLIKHNKLPNLLPFINKTQNNANENVIDIYSEEEIIEHEPITGDIEQNKKNVLLKTSTKEKILLPESLTVKNNDDSKKESIITEKDFDKFARRNSITYENCLKVNFDGGESHNVIKTVVEKDVSVKCNSKQNKIEPRHVDNKIKPTQNSLTHIHNNQSKNMSTAVSVGLFSDVSHKTYPSKVKMAYQSVMTAKRHLEQPLTFIEDKPVKVVYMDTNVEYIPSQLNVQGKELKSAMKQNPIIDMNTHSSCDSLDSDLMEANEEGKSQEDIKIKSRHQRKQVLTPVETPELELIEPEDLGFDNSPKKKRKTDECKFEKNTKAMVPKKSYLLGRSITIAEDKAIHVTKPFDMTKNLLKDNSKQHQAHPSHKDTVSAIDNLVLAAALIETQSENIKNNISSVNKIDIQSNIPVKRGRGRPRKYPPPELESDKTKNIKYIQKKPRLIDTKVDDSFTEEDDSSDDGIVRENWTMGKINENIVCPICNKLFRSENVVFKHVKHCTGPSPNRSESDRRRSRQSQDSVTTDSRDDEMETFQEDVPKKRKSKDRSPKHTTNKDEIIVIEDTPIKEKTVKRELKQERKIINSKTFDNVNNLVCEFCGKTFRQLSYLVSHKLQHNKEDLKKCKETDHQTFKSVFSCEVCKKEFRKLHHLVQHRIIHNPNSNNSARLSRKNSVERNENKIDKASNRTEDPSAGFRCEPCDKSFRKLHHLVEHRETHDGINRQKITSSMQVNNEKSIIPSQCEICKKTFRKLQHLIEHKQQHLETNSEKSDIKNARSSLSTRDIIHECSLCYMVFPNEHSLNKHTIFCQRKKKQSAAKQMKQESNDIIEENGSDENSKQEETIIVGSSDAESVLEGRSSCDKEVVLKQNSNNDNTVHNAELPKSTDKPPHEVVIEPINKAIIPQPTVEKNVENIVKTIDKDAKTSKNQSETLTRDTKTEEKEVTKITPKKKLIKEKIQPNITKRHKTINAPIPIIGDAKSIESSDDDEVRYMLNPNFKVDMDTSEGKSFMKVRAKKRNSLQIERPNSKDLVKRRISLQHPPKVARLKSKSIESQTMPTNTSSLAKSAIKPAFESVPSIDSDDSDIKYSFPKTIPEKTQKSGTHESSKDEKKIKRKPLGEKRKSLSGIAKRKSLGKIIAAKPKMKASPIKQIKRRTAEAEHRCDCGQLFSSAALLSRHTTIAHTPPRIRRRRSPPPEIDTKTVVKSSAQKSIVIGKTRKSVDLRKSSVKSDASNTSTKPDKTTRKSVVDKSDGKTPARKSGEALLKSGVSSMKPRRNAAHAGVPVPIKMRKLMERIKK